MTDQQSQQNQQNQQSQQNQQAEPEQFAEDCNPNASARARLGNVASNAMGDSRAGDMAAEKRLNLLHAQGEPQVGRRTNDPEPEAPWYKRRSFFTGILSGLLVVVGAMIVLMVVASLGK